MAEVPGVSLHQNLEAGLLISTYTKLFLKKNQGRGVDGSKSNVADQVCVQDVHGGSLLSILSINQSTLILVLDELKTV